jgi:transposase
MKTVKNKSGKPVDISGINPQELKNWIKQDDARWAAIKCQSLIALYNGVSVTQVCNVLNVTRESLRVWRNHLKREGPQGLISQKKKGRKSCLTPELEDDLKKVILKSPAEFGYDEKYWNGKLIRLYLEKKWSIEIAIRTVQNWLLKTGIRKSKRVRLN